MEEIRRTEPRQRVPSVEIAALIAILVLAAGLRLWGLGTKSFWVDELFAVDRSRVLRQALAYCSVNHEPPLRYYLVIVRGIFQKGVGLETLWPNALALFGWGVGILMLAVARSRVRQASC